MPEHEKSELPIAAYAKKGNVQINIQNFIKQEKRYLTSQQRTVEPWLYMNLKAGVHLPS